MRDLFKIDIPEKRNFGLDLLRFIAIFTVLVSHSLTVLPEKFQFAHKFIFDGVMVFFVLSGFLIGRIFLRDFNDVIHYRDILRFWKRRWWRTLPAYYFTVLLLVVLSFLLDKPIEKWSVIKSLFFIQSFTYHNGVFFPESWSLAIEEWFYLILPVFAFFQFFFGRPTFEKNVIKMFFIFIIGSLAIRFYFYQSTGNLSISTWDQTFRSPVITRLDSILMGVLAAWLYTFKRSFFDKMKNVAFIIGLSIFAAHKIYVDYYLTGVNFYLSVISLSLIPFSIMLMLPKFYYLKESRFKFFNSVIIKGSLISYSMYLLNLSVISFLILQPLQIHYILKFLLFWVLTVSCSTLMYKYVEQLFLKFRD